MHNSRLVGGSFGDSDSVDIRVTCAFWERRPGQADSVAICMSCVSLVAVLGKQVCSYLHDLRISGALGTQILLLCA